MTSSEWSERSTPRGWILCAAFPIVVSVLAHRFGEIVYLTRTDRVLDPVRMAARGFELWNPYWDLGAVQFQTVGYWLPFDAVFVLGQALGVAPWLTERIFMSALIVVALWGFVRLADALRIGLPAARVVGALVYALSPVMLSRVGFQTVFVMGLALLPWAMVPLVRACETGSPRRAAARSALAIALMGGANASVVVAVLPAPLLYVLTRQRSKRRTLLLAWWVLLVPLATLWWLVGLALFSQYGPDVLLYTEQLDDTVRATPIFEVLRGTADWVSGLALGTPAGFHLANRDLAILATASVAGLGLAGLSRQRLTEQRFLVLCLVMGVIAVGGGFGGLFGNVLSDQYRWMLEGPLLAFRNVYKFQPLVTLALSLGATWAVTGLAESSPVRDRTAAKLIAVVPALALVVVAALPLWNNTLTRGPGFEEIPPAWEELDHELSDNATGRVLVVPGLPEADFDWGYTSQLPLQWGSDIAWATRSQAPLSGLESLQYLDAVELALERGGDPGLVSHLRRGGFSTVVVPSDQLTERYAAPSPDAVNEALIASGLELSGAFGPAGYGLDDLRQIQVYDVPDPAPMVVAYPSTSLSWLSGDIESVMQIPADVFGDRAYVLVNDQGPVPASVDPNQWLITDGRQAYRTTFGFSRNNRSYVYGSADASWPPLDPQDATVLSLSSIESVTASSTGPGVFATDLPAFQPSNVVDGDSATFWQPARVEFTGTDVWGSSDPWIDIQFEEPRRVDSIDIELLVGALGVPTTIEVTTLTDGGAVVSRLDPREAEQPLQVVSGTTSNVRVSIALDSYRDFGDQIGIRELTIDDLVVDRRLSVPSQLRETAADPDAADPAWVFTRGRRALSPFVSLNSEEQIARAFTVPKQGDFEIVPTASAQRSQELIDALGRTPSLAVGADSTLGNSPVLSPRNLVDDDPTTNWRSGQTTQSRNPRVTIWFEWDDARTVSELRLDAGTDVASPLRARIELGGELRRAKVDDDGWIRFPEATGNSMVVTLSYESSPGGDTSSWIGFDGIEVPALVDLYPGPLDPSESFTVSCDEGLSVDVAGTSVEFAADSTVGRLLDGRPIALSACDDASVRLDAGPTLMDASSGSSLLTIDQIVLGNEPTLSVADDAGRRIDVQTWDSQRRTIDVAAGEEVVLVVSEMFNRGWTASLDGDSLEAIRIDGWRQGFVVPEGPAGSVTLSFGPDRIFKIGTLLGVFALLAVVVLAILPDRRRDPLDPAPEGHLSDGWWVAIAAVAALLTVGLAALLLPLLLVVRRLRPSAMPWIAAGALGLAAVVHVFVPRVFDVSATAWNVSSSPVSVLAAVSLLAVLSVLIPPSRADRRDIRRSHLVPGRGRR